MGGFKTSYGIEVTNGIAVPFPITSQKVIDGLSRCLDETIPLPVADLGDRIALDRITYADIWKARRWRSNSMRPLYLLLLPVSGGALLPDGGHLVEGQDDR